MADASRAVFLSYRREETRHIAGRLADRLTDRLGPEQVFMDVDTVEPGADFAAVIAREVASVGHHSTIDEHGNDVYPAF